MNSTRLSAAVFAAALCCISAFAQAPVKARFVSPEGGFAIDLPGKMAESVQPLGESVTGAGTYTWRTDVGNFTVGFVDGIREREGHPPVLRELADTVITTQLKLGGTVTGIADLSFHGNSGIEIRVRRPGMTAVNKFILVGSRLYVLTADWPAAEDGLEAMRIIDSFALVDRRELIA